MLSESTVYIKKKRVVFDTKMFIMLNDDIAQFLYIVPNQSF